MKKDLQYFKFCAYGFLKNLRFYEPFFMLYLLERNLSFAHIGILYAIRQIGINLLEIPSGLFADALGRRSSMLLSFLAYIGAFVGFYLGQDFLTLLLPMALYSFGDAFRTGTHKAMIFDYLRQTNQDHMRTAYYGNTRAWSQRGAGVSALIAGALVFWRGSYAAVFLFTIIPYALDFLLILSYPRNLDGPGRGWGALGEIRGEFSRVLKELLSSFSHPQLLRGISSLALYTGYYKGCKDFLQPLLRSMALGLPVFLSLVEQERTALVTAVLYSALYFLTAFASGQSGALAKRFPALETPLNRTLYAGTLLGGAAGLAYLLNIPFLAVSLYVGIFVIENLRKPMGVDYVSQRISQGSMASALSVESQVETLFAAGFSLVLGFLVHYWGLGAGIILVSLLVGIMGYGLRLKAREQ